MSLYTIKGMNVTNIREKDLFHYVNKKGTSITYSLLLSTKLAWKLTTSEKITLFHLNKI